MTANPKITLPTTREMSIRVPGGVAPMTPGAAGASSATPQRADVRPEQPCPVGYCRAGAGHRTLHDIAPCLKTCGPLRPGKGREHNPACPNHNFYGETP